VTLNTPPLPFTCFQVLLAAGVRHVLAEHHDARITRHFILHAGVQQVHHRGGIASERGSSSVSKLFGRGIDVGRYTYSRAVSGSGWGEASAHVGGHADFLIHLTLDGLDLGFGSPRRRR